MKENRSHPAKVAVKRRKRRSTEEILDCLLDAACEEFERNGFIGAKTADIARRAGVAEPLIFKHFGSKANLFHDAIFKPLNNHLTKFTNLHFSGESDEGRLDESSRLYALYLKNFVESHCGMLTSLLFTRIYSSENVRSIGQVDGLNEYFERAVETAILRRGEDTIREMRLRVRISFATTLMCAMCKDWLFHEELGTEEEINRAIIDYILAGFNASITQNQKTGNVAGKRKSSAAAISKKKSNK